MIKDKPILQFLELLRAGLWGFSPDINLFQGVADWKEILTISERQTVLGHVFDGISKLPSNLQPSSEIMHKLIYFVTRIEQTHGLLNNELTNVVSALHNQNVPSILLKGQGVAQCYSNPLRRQCGDIDIYVGIKNCEKSKEVLLELGAKEEHLEAKSIKHLNFSLNNVEVELHFLVDKLLGKSRNLKFQNWVQENLEQQELDSWLCNNIKINKPSLKFDSFYIFYHACMHLSSGGLGLRQLCDWTMVLYKYRSEINEEDLLKIIEDTKTLRAWQVFGYIVVQHLGFPKSDFPFYSDKYSSLGDKAINIILHVGNFGVNKFYDSKRPNNYLLGKLYSCYYVHKYLLKIYPILPMETGRYYAFYLKTGIAKLIRRI